MIRLFTLPFWLSGLLLLSVSFFLGLFGSAVLYAVPLSPSESFEPAMVFQSSQDRSLMLYHDPSCGEICNQKLRLSVLPLVRSLPEIQLRIVPFSFSEEVSDPALLSLTCDLLTYPDLTSEQKTLLLLGDLTLGESSCDPLLLESVLEEAEAFRQYRRVSSLPMLEISGIPVEGVLPPRDLEALALILWSSTPISPPSLRAYAQ